MEVLAHVRKALVAFLVPVVVGLLPAVEVSSIEAVVAGAVTALTVYFVPNEG